MANLHRIEGRAPNLREMLLAAGIGEFNATLSIPYMYFMPRTCDPYTQGVMQIIEGLQNLLRARGHKVPLDGWLGPDTAGALQLYAGAGWADKTWMQIYGDVMRGQRAPGFERKPAAALAEYTEREGLGSITTIADIVTSPLAWIAGGALAYHLLGRKRRGSSASSGYKRIRL